MKFCQHCGAQIDEKAVICIHCGRALEAPKNQPAAEDSSSIGFAILAFLFPIVGFILYAVNSSTHPKKAKSALKGAIVGLVLGFVGTIIYYVAYFILMFSLEEMICILPFIW
ncbi:MAG: zinc-ribbon domain-containing protein [Clostridia bacterium]|nr:zinc-ribbon domain-containing protein [Clostridia bacterium]